MFDTAVNAFVHPTVTFEQELAKATLGKALVKMAVAGLIQGLLLAVVLLLFLPFLTGASATIAIPLIVVGVVLFSVVWGIVWNVLVFLAAKLLGGKGSYTGLLYLTSLYAPLLAILSIIPIVNILVFFYSLYLLFAAIRHSQQLSEGRAIAVIAVLFGLVLLLYIVLIVVIASLVVLVGNPASGGGGADTCYAQGAMFSVRNQNFEITDGVPSWSIQAFNTSGRALSGVHGSATFIHSFGGAPIDIEVPSEILAGQTFAISIVGPLEEKPFPSSVQTIIALNTFDGDFNRTTSITCQGYS
ncbi:MAG: YIP1 family protein [Candidatus Diapherotrites archaeon]|nr:YIP1 family protein [Candidatus Diapherotrites archaeon]